MAIQSEVPAVPQTGLSQTEAQQRLTQDGPNELSKGKKRTGLTIILEVLREPMFLLLLASSGLYMLLGDTHEALMLVSMILLVIGITFYQENKTEHALEALRDLSSPRALVIRDGESRRIPGREVVREDLVLLSEGDRVPADGLLISGPGLSLDESLLTGESVTVRRNPDGAKEEARLYAGTLVVQGQGLMRVEGIGMQTELGKIGRSLQTLKSEDTLLQKEIRRLVRLFGIWGIILCLLVVLIYGLARGNWLHGFLAGITLAMSVLPEEFPMVLTVFLALGAWRIAKNRVLTRKTHAIEALGAATVLCTDKTGTLTLNRMTVVRLANPEGRELDLTEPSGAVEPAFTAVLHFGALASQSEGIDPMDQAVIEIARQRLPEEFKGEFQAQTPIRVYPISKAFLAVTLAWPRKDNAYTIAVKGAPEAVMQLCQLDETQQASMTRQVQKMAAAGLRVLAVAKSRWEGALPEVPGEFSGEFVGLLGYMDPIRPAVPDAIRACHTAGIRVVMITGDYPETAKSIARQIGLKNLESLITGPMINDMSDEELQEKIRGVDTFARMVPEQKLRLVNALKADGEIVAMTGDGVNDAPALKAAHIGIAMGKRGTDVAREAAHLVLLDDDFASIVQAIRLGRRIFDNLRKAMAYIFSVHIPIAGMAILPVIFHWPLVLFPAHIAFIEMVIDPACSVAFEAEPSEGGLMHRQPRPLNEPLFSKSIFLRAILQGHAVLLIILVVYGIALWQQYGEADARTMAFITLLVSNLMLITTNLSGQVSVFKLPFLKNKAYWFVLVSAMAMLTVILAVPLLRNLFHFSQLHVVDYVICVAAACLCLLVLEVLKRVKCLY